MLLSLCAFKLPWGVYALENTNVDWALYKINLLLLLLLLSDGNVSDETLGFSTLGSIFNNTKMK